jgi:excisionase family DNA binding protein
VAKLLRVKKSYVYELIASHRLKAIRLSERRTRIPESAVEEYLQKELG